jgi:transcription termination/antitermination protein NusG
VAARWYIVHAYSNFEKKVAEQIQETANQKGLGHKVEKILVPSEEVTEIVRGRKKVTERRFYPGYVLVKMELDDATYHLVKDTPKVTGFLGADAGKRPTPVSEKEVQRILGVVEEGVERPAQMIRFDLGEKVKVIDGPFDQFEGLVEEVDESRQRLKVAVSIFGRATPVELEYAQVEKLS